jgi:hypothetical protein
MLIRELNPPLEREQGIPERPVGAGDLPRFPTSSLKASELKVVPVNDRAGISAFIAAGRRAQSINPHWVEPVHEEIRMTFDRRRAPFLRENVIQPFVAFRNGEPVGRIVATIEAAHQKKFGDACGFFGFIDAIDDDAVFAALFAEAERFLRERGMRLARGPFSLTINHESGLLVDGFDQPHVVRTNHSPPHYAAHVERLGYRKAMDLVAYACRVADAELPARVERVARAGLRLHFHRLSLMNWSRDFPRVLALYNDAWSDNEWATPVSAEEARFIAHLMLPACKPRWIQIASFRGEDVAVAVHIPDANEALKGLHGRLLPFGFAKFLWRIHVRGTGMTRAPMTGVAKKWRNTKIGALAVSGLVARTIEDARAAGVEDIEYSWMLETNTEAIKGVLALPARHTRTFRIYERNL